MRKERVLVTGSEGSLMQALLPFLTDKYEVIGVDMTGTEQLDLANGIMKLPRFIKTGHMYRFIRGDLANEGFVNRVFEDFTPDYVIQAAARIYGVGGFNRYCSDILGDDITLHRNILKASVNHDVKRVVYISSSMVYEREVQNIPVREDTVHGGLGLAPRTDYGLSKFVGERLSMSYQKQYGLQYTIWRPFNIITPYEESNGETGVSHVFADFIRMIVRDELNPMPVLGDGHQVRCFTWIDDVAAGIAQSTFKDEAANQIYNIGNPEPVTMRTLATMIYNEAFPMAAEPLEFLETTPYPNDVRYRVPDVDKIRDELGWRPKVDVKKSVALCVGYALKEKGWAENFLKNMTGRG